MVVLSGKMRYIQPRHTPTYNQKTLGASRNKPQKQRAILFWSVATLSVFFLGAGIVLVTTKRNVAEDALLAVGITAVKGEQTEAAPATPLLDSEIVTTMDQEIGAVLARYPTIESSVSIIDTKTGATYSYGYDGVFLGASVNKLITATLLLRQIDQKKITLDSRIQGQKVSDLLQRLIVSSDNNAWDTLNTYLTSRALRQWATDNGLESYTFDDNTISTADAAALVARIYNGTLLSSSSTKLLLDYMANANETNHIVANVPQGVNVYHKAGWLDDHVHDAAIIDNGSRPFAIVIFTKGVNIYSGGKTNPLYAGVTQAALSAFAPRGS